MIVSSCCVCPLAVELTTRNGMTGQVLTCRSTKPISKHNCKVNKIDTLKHKLPKSLFSQMELLVLYNTLSLFTPVKKEKYV